MSKLTIIAIAVSAIIVLWLIERIVTFYSQLQKLEKQQQVIIAQERYLFNRLTLLLAVDQYQFLLDPVFQDQRRKLYNTPGAASYQKINELLSKAIASPNIDKTIELSLSSEIKGLVDLLNTNFDEYKKMVSIIIPVQKNGIKLLTAMAFKQKCLLSQAFQKDL